MFTRTSHHQSAGFENTPFGNRFFREFKNRKCGGKHQFMNLFGAKNPVNIEETTDSFIVKLYAAGLQKEQFAVAIQNDILTIKYTAPEAGDKKYIVEEFQPSSFERAFQLNGLVVTESCDAHYADGILTIVLQKDAAAFVPAQEIKIN